MKNFKLFEKCNRRIAKRVTLIAVLLAMCMPQAWAWYVKGSFDSWTVHDIGADGGSVTYYDMTPGTYYYQFSDKSGSNWSGGDLIVNKETWDDHKSLKSSDFGLTSGQMTVRIYENSHISIQKIAGDGWQLKIYVRPAYYFRYDWAIDSWGWSGWLVNCGDGTYATEGRYNNSATGFNYNTRPEGGSEKPWCTNLIKSGDPTHEVKCFFIYNPDNSNRSLTIEEKNSTSGTNYIFFDNTNAGWNDSKIQLVLGHLSYSRSYTMTKVGSDDNTNLYYVSRSGNDWTGEGCFAYFGMIGGSEKFDDGAWASKSMYDANHYSKPLYEHQNLASSYNYLISKADNTNGHPITVEEKGNSKDNLNSTQTYNYAISTNGGVDYTTVTSGKTPAQILVTSYKFNSRTGITNSNCTIAVDNTTRTKNLSVAYTGKTTITVSNVWTGYSFVGWYVGNSLLNALPSFVDRPTSAKTVTARIKANQYKVEFDKNGGSGSMSDQTFTYDIAQNLTTCSFTAPSGKVFMGWSTSPSGDVVYTDGQSVSNLSSTDGATVKLYAIWAYSLTYSCDGADSGCPSNGGAFALPNPLPTLYKGGYEFGGWYTNSAKTTPAVAGATLAASTTLYAKWTPTYASGTYTFFGNATVGSSPYKTVTTTTTDYAAFRIDNLFFTDSKIQYQNDGGDVESNDYNGWKLKKTGTIKFLVEEDSDVKLCIGSIGSSESCAISYTDQDGDKHNNVSVAAGSHATYEVKGGELVTISISVSDNSHSVTLKQIAISASVSCTAAPTVSAATTGTTTPTTQVVNCAGISSLGTGTCTITSYGFVYGTSTNPTTSDNVEEVGTTYTTTNTAFSKTIESLTPGATYYVRPYATNGNGTAYGDQTSFTMHYAITTGSHTNGSVTIPSSAAPGASVAISATPSTGYSFSSWTIKKTSDGSDVTASVSLSGTTSATFTMPDYAVTVDATFSCTTPTITGPSNATVCKDDDSPELSVSASANGGSLSYQWYVNTTNAATVDDDHDIDDATSDSYDAPTGTAGTKYYYCVVTNTTGSCSATSDIATVTVTAPTAISSHPTNVTNGVVGSASSLSVTATGTGTLTYQWYTCNSDGSSPSAISSATNASAITATLSITPASAGTTYYKCVVHSDCGSDQTSSVASILAKNTISPTLTYNAYSVAVGSTLTATLNKDGSTGSVTYISSNDAVATVASDGTVTGVSSGSVTITATIAATSDYWSNTVTSSTITVTAPTYDVTHTLYDVEFVSGTPAGSDQATRGTDYEATFEVVGRYILPTDVTVTIGGVEVTKDTEYTWNSSTGELVVIGSYITGDIEIEIEGIPEPIPTLITYNLHAPKSTDDQPSNLDTTSVVTVAATLKGDTLKNFTNMVLGSSFSITGKGKDKSGGKWTAKIGNTPSDSTTTDANSVKLSFDVHSDYELNVSSVTLKVLSVSSGDQIYRAKLSDGNSSVFGRVKPSKDTETAVVFGSFSGIKFSGTVTLTLWVWSSGSHEFRIMTPIQIDGTLTKKPVPVGNSVTAVTSTGDDTYGTVSAAASTVAEGGTTVITAVPATGYKVTNWAVSGEGSSISPSGASNSNTTTLTMGSADATVTVTFGPKTYTLTLDKNGGSADGSASITWNQRFVTFDPHATAPNASFSLDGYYTAAEGGTKIINGSGSEYIVSEYIPGWTSDVVLPSWAHDADATLYAYWRRYINLNSNWDYHGTYLNYGSVSVILGGAPSGYEAATGEEGYTLQGYYTEKLGGTKVFNANGTYAADDVDGFIEDGKWIYTTEGTLSLYAHWAKQYTVTYDDNDATSGSAPSATSAFFGDDVTVAGNTGTLVKTGYTFVGWNTAADGSGSFYAVGSKFIITDDITLYAQWGDCGSGGTEVRFLAANKNDAGDNFANMSKDATQLVGGGTAKLIAVAAAGLNDVDSKIGYRADAGSSKMEIVFDVDATSTLDIYVNQDGKNNRTYQLASFTSVKALSAITPSDYSTNSVVTTNISTASAGFSGATGTTSSTGTASVSSGVIAITQSGGLKISYSSLAAGYYVFQATGSASEYIYGYDLTPSGGGSGSCTTYDVSFADMTGFAGSSTLPDDISDVYDGATIAEPVQPTATGYAFAGWYKEGACSNKWDFSTDVVDDNITLYAKWVSLTEQYTFHMGDGDISNHSWNVTTFTPTGYYENQAISNFEIPNQGRYPSFFVGYEGEFVEHELYVDEGYSKIREWDDYNNMTTYQSGYIKIQGNASPISDGNAKTAAGAKGTLQMSSSTHSENWGLVFIPDGFGLTISYEEDETPKTLIVPLHKTDNEKVWETESFTTAKGNALTAAQIAGTFKVGLATATPNVYVDCYQTTDEAASAINARKLAAAYGGADMAAGASGRFQIIMSSNTSLPNFGLRWVPLENHTKQNGSWDGMGVSYTLSDKWSLEHAPTIEEDVYIEHTTSITNDAQANSVYINKSSTYMELTISPIGSLLVMNDIKAKMADDDAYRATTENDITIETDYIYNGSLITAKKSTDTKASYRFCTKAYKVDGYGYINQFIGIPFTEMDAFQLYGSLLYQYDKDANQWVTCSQNMEAYHAYNILRRSTEGRAVFDLDGTLILPGIEAGNKEKVLECNSGRSAEASSWRGEHLFANSWTAPIEIGAMTEGDFQDVDPTIYIFNAGSVNTATDDQKEEYDLGDNPGQWTALPVNDVKENPENYSYKVIPAMQAFSIRATAANGTLTLDYKKHVYDPIMANSGVVDHTALRAPKQNVEPSVRLRMVVTGENHYKDETQIHERADFSNGHDAGWDGYKIFGNAHSPQLYTVSDNKQLSVNAIPDMEGTVVGFEKGSDDNVYTFSFKYDGEDIWYLNDLKEQTSTLINNENTYMFTAEEGDTEARFIISATPINAPAVTTDIDNVSDGAKARKIMINDKLYIILNGKMYDATGKAVK